MMYDTGALRQLWQEAFGDSDAFLDAFFTTAYAPDRCQAVMDGNRAVSALYWIPHRLGEKKIAYIYAVATAKSHRGQGLCRRLMAQTHEILRAQGYAGALLVPGNAGLGDFYAAMGYHYCSRIREFSAVAAPCPIPVQKLSVTNYAHRRKAMLPANSVLPGKEALAFLATQADFYAGKNWLLAGCRMDGRFIGMEFLGDEAQIPGILAALEAKIGSFRTPGNHRDFAMYLPFLQDVNGLHFAFAFD